MFKIILMLILQ